jgi:hypothetical protein
LSVPPLSKQSYEMRYLHGHLSDDDVIRFIKAEMEDCEFDEADFHQAKCESCGDRIEEASRQSLRSAAAVVHGDTSHLDRSDEPLSYLDEFEQDD